MLTLEGRENLFDDGRHKTLLPALHQDFHSRNIHDSTFLVVPGLTETYRSDVHTICSLRLSRLCPMHDISSRTVAIDWYNSGITKSEKQRFI